MKLWLITAMLLPTVPHATPDAVLERLSRVRQFAFGYTGYAGVISTGEKDYRAVLARRTALADFERLFADGNIQAKCYALVGIQRLDPARFKDLAHSLATSKAEVTTESGCIIGHERLVPVLAQIAAGKYP